MEADKTIKEHWPDIKIGLKSKYPQLTEGDLGYFENYEDEIFKNLQMKTGKTRESLIAEMNAIALKG